MTTRQVQPTGSEQLSLLAVSELPIQFRLDQRTRQRGLAHIAAIRRQLAAQSTDVRASSGATEDSDLDTQRHEAA